MSSQSDIAKKRQDGGLQHIRKLKYGQMAHPMGTLWNVSAPMCFFYSTELNTTGLDEESVDNLLVTSAPFLSDICLVLRRKHFFIHSQICCAGMRGSVMLSSEALKGRRSTKKIHTCCIDGKVPHHRNEEDDEDVDYMIPVLNYMYSGDSVLQVITLPGILVTAYTLRIQSLFNHCLGDIQLEMDSRSGFEGTETMLVGCNLCLQDKTLGSEAKAILLSLQAAFRTTLGYSTSKASPMEEKKATVRRPGRKASDEQSKVKLQERAKRATMRQRRTSQRIRRMSKYKSKIQSVTSESVRKPKGKIRRSGSMVLRGSQLLARTQKMGDGVEMYTVKLSDEPGSVVTALSEDGSHTFEFLIPTSAVAGDKIQVSVVDDSGDEAEEMNLTEVAADEDNLTATSYVYLDANDNQFGPFPRAQMEKWYSAGHLPSDMKIRAAQDVGNKLAFEPLATVFDQHPAFYPLN